MPKHSRCCVLNSWEAEELRKGAEPTCTNHLHISRVEAHEMIHFPDGSNSPYARPIAKAMGKNRIVMTGAFQWKVIDRWRFPRTNLVPQG